MAGHKRTVRAAVTSYVRADGSYQWAQLGETVDVADSYVETFDHLESLIPAAPVVAPVVESEPSDEGPPPKAGRGSSLDAWSAYAAAHDVEVAEDMKRDDIIAALDAAGVPTE